MGDDSVTTAYGAASSDSIRKVEPIRISTEGDLPVRDPCEVAIETPLTVTIEEVGSFIVMCTPCDAEALAVGFAFTEGIITGFDDITDLACVREPLTVVLELANPGEPGAQRNLIVSSSCGLCGHRDIKKLLDGLIACGDSLKIPGDMLVVAARDMQARQELFQRTGGTHAAGILSAKGELIALGEDIGRHNALDKAIGRCILGKRPTDGCGLVLSGRVSVELIVKAARAGIELVAAVSAPSSLAIDAAKRCNITLCGFVRDTRATVYTHPHRIIGLEELT